MILKKDISLSIHCQYFLNCAHIFMTLGYCFLKSGIMTIGEKKLLWSITVYDVFYWGFFNQDIKLQKRKFRAWKKSLKYEKEKKNLILPLKLFKLYATWNWSQLKESENWLLKVRIHENTSFKSTILSWLKYRPTFFQNNG